MQGPDVLLQMLLVLDCNKPDAALLLFLMKVLAAAAFELPRKLSAIELLIIAKLARGYSCYRPAGNCEIAAAAPALR